MVWVLSALLVAAAVWLALALKKEHSERITLDEMMLLAEEARKSSPLARALQHRQVVREHRGDPDGGDPVITDVDRTVREIAKLSRRILRARAKRDKLASRQEHLSRVESASPQGVEQNASKLAESLEQQETMLQVLTDEVERLIRALQDASERERATVDAKLRRAPGPENTPAVAAPAPDGHGSGIHRVAAQAAELVKEITSPHGRMVTADGPSLGRQPGPMPARLPPKAQPTEKIRREPTRMKGDRVLGRPPTRKTELEKGSVAAPKKAKMSRKRRVKVRTSPKVRSIADDEATELAPRQ